MRTITLKLYSFEELSEEAQQKAIERWRNSDRVDTSWYWNEAHESVKKFHEIFGTESGWNSWLDLNLHSIDDRINDLRGIRLQKYIWNNYKSDLFKGKYYHSQKFRLTDHRIIHRRVKSKQITNNCPNKGKWSNSYYSGIFLNNDCVMTGVCYDMDLLDPIYTFLNARKGDVLCGWMFESMSISDLFEECLSSLRESLQSEDEYRFSDEGIREDLENQDYEFEEDGTLN